MCQDVSVAGKGVPDVLLKLDVCLFFFFVQ